jgi:hypothetical protein
LACRQGEIGTSLGDTYERIARPVVWRTLPRGQAESLGLKPGDIVLSYNDVPVRSNDDLLELEAELGRSGSAIPLTALRGDEELNLVVRPGELGYMPEADRYPSGLAVALQDILSHFGVDADYDWLAALSSESFTFTAEKNECRSRWPGGLSATYLDDLARSVGLSLSSLYEPPETDSAPAVPGEQEKLTRAVRTALNRDRAVLVHGGWPEPGRDYWGLATRYDPDDSLLYGYTLGSADQLPLTGIILEAYEVRRAGKPELQPDDMLTAVLVQALEMGQAYSDTGWQSGIAAYDLWITALDTIPFCPQCSTGSQTCLDRLVWTLRANKESANRFLTDMRVALPDQANLIDEIIADNTAIIGKLDGIIQSGAKVGTLPGQQKLAMAVGEIEQIEADLLTVYEDLIGDL